MSSDVTSSSTSVMSNLPTVEHVKAWSRDEVKTFLQKNKARLDLEYRDIEILYNQRVKGSNFFDFTAMDFERWGIPGGPAKEIDKLIKEIKGELPVATTSHQPTSMGTLTNLFGQM
ncbi:4291_t:CDS:2, partial [Paraglomus brasilianum]